MLHKNFTPKTILDTNHFYEKNMGNTDHIIRLVLATLFLVLFFANVATGILGIVLLVAVLIFVLTSIVSFCPLCALVGAGTCAVKKN
jgi:Flp pilus assembly protein TadB